jgi:hypothetical protein
MIYRHTQAGALIRALLGVFIVFGAFMGVVGPGSSKTGFWILVGVMMIIWALFHSLTVEIDPRCLRWRFGPGVLKWDLLISDLESAQASRSHWYNGWGIRWTPTGWLYNVSGLDCVNIHLKNGKTIRIGTNDSKGLLEALRKVGVETISKPTH